MENKKFKVAKDVKTALDIFFSDSNHTGEQLLKNHMIHEVGAGSWVSSYEPLAKLTITDVVHIVDNGYEEVNPLALEILDIINKVDNTFTSGISYYDGYKAGLEIALEIIEKHDEKGNNK